MRRLFEFKSSQQPFLAPLGARRRLPSLSRETFDRLPPAAAPLAVTLVGGLALVVVLGWFLSRGANGTPPLPPQQAAATVEAPAAPQLTTSAAADEDQAMAAPEIDAAPAEEATTAETAMPAVEPAIETAAESVPELAPLAPVTEPMPDPDATAAIPRTLPGLDALEPDVAVAETEAEVEALEALQRREVELDATPDAPTVPSNEETAAIAPEETAPMRAATTTQHVNMRAGPDDDAEVLMVVPARAEIEAEADCGWCAVAYQGRSGYVYRTFIRYAD